MTDLERDARLAALALVEADIRGDPDHIIDTIIGDDPQHIRAIVTALPALAAEIMIEYGCHRECAMQQLADWRQALLADT